MTDRELYKQVLNEYLVFSDKSPADFVWSLVEVREKHKPILIRYLTRCITCNEAYACSHTCH